MKISAFTRPLAAAGFGAVLAVSLSSAALAEEAVIQMHHIDASGVGAPLGTVTAMDTADGLVLKLDLDDTLTPGAHGFHVHQNGSCEPAMKDGKSVAGLGAGGHYDPKNAGKHMGPAGRGHLGDLPVIYVEVDEDGTRPVKRPLVAPYLKVADLKGRALVIHAEGDNYSDDPKPLGGGGARVACGIAPN
jgi:Cu-Zn family superoxide dismutase